MRLFLSQLPHSPDFTVMTPQDVCIFLVWSDQFGKTQVHAVSSPFLGRMGVLGCACPTRLAAGTIQNMIQQMTEILRTHGRSRSWDAQLKVGNPCLSIEVKNYIKQCKEEQAKSHVLPKDVSMVTDNWGSGAGCSCFTFKNVKVNCIIMRL